MFKVPQDNKREVIWISHRGYKESATENTKEAFEAAAEKGFRYLETDLRTTSDGHIVLSHDKTLYRIAKNPIDVETSTRRELEQVELPKGNRLYFLDGLLRDFKDLHWTFDIKPTANERTTEIFINLVQNLGLSDWVQENTFLISWSHEKEDLLRRFFPKVTFYKTKKDCWIAGISSLIQMPFFGGIESGRTYSLVPDLYGFSLFKPRIVANYHRRGARALAFLPKNKEETRRALDVGFDEILTDNLPGA